MDKSDKFKRLIEFLFKSEHSTFFTKFEISNLILDVTEETSINDKSISYSCNLLTVHHSFNEYNELSGLLSDAGDKLYDFFKKIIPNSEGSIDRINSDYAGNKFDDDFFLGIQVMELETDWSNETVITNWRITYDK